MPLNISLPDDFLTDEQRERLRELIETEEIEFEEALARVCLAAAREYKEMLLGLGMPTRAAEIRERRLYHLIREYFEGRIPSEAEVSAMFQLTMTQARSLIQAVVTKYRYELEFQITETLRAALQTAGKEAGADKIRFTIKSDNIRDQLNQIIAEQNPSLDTLRAVPNMARVYRASPDTYLLLCTELGVDPDEDLL